MKRLKNTEVLQFVYGFAVFLSSTYLLNASVEDDEDEDDDNEDDSNDPEWRIDDDRDSESGKRKIKTSDEEGEPPFSVGGDIGGGGEGGGRSDDDDNDNDGDGSGGGGSVGGVGGKKTNSKPQQTRKEGRKCREKT